MLTATMQRPPFYQLRAHQFSRLDATGSTYLDYAGSALYPASLIQPHAEMLLHSVLGNPHSDSPASRTATALIESARARVLQFFDASPSEYAVVFTANASASIRLVAEAFPFTADSSLVMTADNHNSINGIREYARRAGARTRYIELDDELRAVNADHAFKPARQNAPSLFAFPAQSNFSGVHHPLRLVETAHRRGFRVLLDAAAYAPTHPLSLRDVPADYVALSFYKMFGYPTGVGALVARHDALDLLQRPSFAGGTVDFVSVQNDLFQWKDGVEAFEDGTANFTAIAAVPAGLDFLEDVGMHRVQRHVGDITAHALEQLRPLTNPSRNIRVVLYGPRSTEQRGGIIAFNLVDAQDRIVPYEIVEAHARAAAISIRGGCFCNPGAAERAFQIPAPRARQFLASGAPFSLGRFREHLGGLAVGALRCSFGIPTTRADIARLVELLGGIGVLHHPD
jgi:selenocysteine lyase/cysteine desulfurase